MSHCFAQEGMDRFLNKKDEMGPSFQKFIEKQKEIIKELEDIKYEVNPKFSSLVNFSEGRNAPIHRWFKYREGYSPDLVNVFLNNRERKVFDPFCGSGTTLVCASQRGIDSVGIDINPLAAFISEVKTRRYTLKDVRKLREHLETILSGDLDVCPADPPELRIIDKVFPEDMLDYLLHLKAAINSITEDSWRDFLFLGWLAILEIVSNTKKEGNGIKYRSTRRTKKGYIHIPFDIWQQEYYGNDRIGFVRNKLEAQFSMMIEDVKSHCLNLPKCQTEVYRGDAIQLDSILDQQKISSAIFSPPYANCFDYFEIFKVELWMGDFVKNYTHLSEFRRKSLGSLWQIRSHNDLDIEEISELVGLIEEEKLWDRRIVSMLIAYFSNMKSVLSKIYSALFPQGKCVIVVGNSAYSNVLIPSDLLLTKIGRKVGFRSPKIVIARHLTTSSQQKKKLEQLKNYLRESVIILQK